MHDSIIGECVHGLHHFRLVVISMKAAHVCLEEPLTDDIRSFSTATPVELSAFGHWSCVSVAIDV